jgi:hypothetical protein
MERNRVGEQENDALKWAAVGLESHKIIKPVEGK